MPVEVIMPKVDMDMETGKVLTWHAAEGQRVEKGSALFDIETDKAAMEVEAEADGILHHRIDEGVDVPIGAPVAWLYAEGETVSEAPVAQSPEAGSSSLVSAADEKAAEPTDAIVVPERRVASGPDGASLAGPRATPLARTLARQNGLALDAIIGTGPLGRIQASDVRQIAEAPDPQASDHSTLSAWVDEPGMLAVTRTGGGSGTPVLFVHGFANDAASWAPIETNFVNRPQIRVDLPCHGKSPKRAYGSFNDLVSEFRRAIDALPEDRLHVVAHSLGAAIVLAAADTRPRKFASLTLIAPAGLGPDINGDVLNGIVRATRPESLAPWLRLLAGDETFVTDGYARAAFAARRDPHLRAAQAALAGIVFPDGTQAMSLKPALHRLQVPVRIVWGKKDRIIPWQHALGAPGRVALHLFEELGHIPHLEAPQDVAMLIDQYL